MVNHIINDYISKFEQLEKIKNLTNQYENENKNLDVSSLIKFKKNIEKDVENITNLFKNYNPTENEILLSLKNKKIYSPNSLEEVLKQL